MLLLLLLFIIRLFCHPSSSQPLQRVAADIADAITSPPSTSLDQPMLPFIQTIQKQVTRGMFLQDIVQI